MTAIGALFLLGPLVVVPLGLYLVGARRSSAARLQHVAIAASVPAAVSLAIALMLPTGGSAAVAALPWMGVAVAHAVAELARVVADTRVSRQPSGWIDAIGASYLAVGATWIVVDRLGLRPFGFDPTIVRLTAVHFHFAGFGLLLVAGRLAERLGGPAPRVAAASVAIGVPLVALGFLGQPIAGVLGVGGVSSGGLAIGVLQLRAAGSLRSSAAMWLARLGSISLFVTMPMAVLWQVGQVAPVAWIDLATMIRVHGVLNALGFAVPSVVAWTLDRAPDRARRPIVLAPR